MIGDSRLTRWVLPILLIAALGWGCASEGKTNVWGQRWDIPHDHNTVGAKLGVWPREWLDIYVQWVTPQMLADGLVPFANDSHRRQVAPLLEDYIVFRVVAVNHRANLSHPFDYGAWRLLLDGKEHRAIVPTGGMPTAADGYFVGSIPSHSIRSAGFYSPAKSRARRPQTSSTISATSVSRSAFRRSIGDELL